MKVLFVLFLLFTHGLVHATGTYEEPRLFVERVFSGETPKPKSLWLNKDLKQEIKNIMGHDLGVIRLRYWREDGRTAWILEEIGKERPITTGFVINENRIEEVKVLVFREVRGWEVRHAFFTDQFKGLTIDENRALTEHIDGISGATLSVRALTKLSRLALFLTEYIKK